MRRFYFFLSLILATLLYLPESLAQNVTIPDANLRAAIEEALGKTSGATITVDDMASLKVLQANDSGISDLTGLESASRLRELHLNRNRITDLSPLSGLKKLYQLDLNHITLSSPT